ncbi:MAG TPA: tagaturonate epimerase family protein [Clostridia bacterium]|nr:tagaturonate epimerase family protein [Clostridia bacterium]
MNGWEQFCIEYLTTDSIDMDEVGQAAKNGFEKFEVYPDSIQLVDGSCFFIARHNGKKALIIYGESHSSEGFRYRESIFLGKRARICELNIENAKVLRNIFSFTKPVSHEDKNITFGLGDRLGIASPGHIKLLKGLPVFPVLAQQSMRELTLTGRSYADVLADVSWAVFQEGYTSGFGADGDHLKSADDIRTALESGYTMITLDCSDYINNSASEMPEVELRKAYSKLAEADRKRLESKYLNKEFTLTSDMRIKFSEETLMRIAVIYLEASKFAIDIYKNIIETYRETLDFEISIDETQIATSPEAHYFVAEEILSGGARITSLAPRFPGEFQKGIDYKGDISLFNQEFKRHVNISEHFGYRISVHSGSDKFLVFPIIGAETGGKFHIKTSGTNWLEAVRLIAMKDPALYRGIHKEAVRYFAEAKKFYHVTAELSNVPNVDILTDTELLGLLDMEDARQLLHITYGYILKEKNPDGSLKYKDKIYAALNRYEGDFYDVLRKHIGKHMRSLGVK